MIKATIKDKASVLEILSCAFDDNPSVNYTIPQDDLRSFRLRGLMEYSFLTCLDFGKVYLNQQRSCCALVLFPDRRRFSLAALLRDLRLVNQVIGWKNVLQVLRRESLIKNCYPAGELRYYVWFVGCLPEVQGRGLGTGLMGDLFEDAERMNRAVYLETSVAANLSWYVRLGFSVYDTLELGYRLFLLRRLIP